MKNSYRCSRVLTDYLDFLSAGGDHFHALVKFVEENYNPKSRKHLVLPKEHLYLNGSFDGDTLLKIHAKDMIKIERMPATEINTWYDVKHYYPKGIAKTVLSTTTNTPEHSPANELGIWITNNDEPVESWTYCGGDDDRGAIQHFMIIQGI